MTADTISMRPVKAAMISALRRVAWELSKNTARMSPSGMFCAPIAIATMGPRLACWLA
ncbi:hypothetical protein D3C76_1659610 [compost metagenome]